MRHMLETSWKSLGRRIRDPIGVIDGDHLVLWANKPMAAIYQYKPKKIIGKRGHWAFKERQNPCDDCPMTDVCKTGRAQVAG